MNYKDFDLGDWIGHISGIIEDETTLDGNEMVDLVEFLTTLREPKTGHWINEDVNGIEYYRCSECRSSPWDSKTKCCPDCGCRMVEPKKSEE